MVLGECHEHQRDRKKFLAACWHVTLSKHKKHTFQDEVTHIASNKDCVLPRQLLPEKQLRQRNAKFSIADEQKVSALQTRLLSGRI